MECGLSCARSCRDLSRDIKCNEECVPGCQCPNGELLNNENRCVPVSQCPCIFEEKVIQPGDSVSIGNCKTWYDIIFNKDVHKVIFLSVQYSPHLLLNFSKSLKNYRQFFSLLIYNLGHNLLQSQVAGVIELLTH